MNEFAEAIPVNNPETILEVPQETVMEELNLTYFYGGESNTFAFYRMPKYLLFDPRFSKLSSDSKILYCCMLDRVSLSISSDWRDKEGRVFIYYSVEEACKLLNKSNRTVTKIMSELDTEKGLGLIERKKQGLGKPDFIFVKNCVISPDQEGKNPAQTKGKNSRKKGITVRKQAKIQKTMWKNQWITLWITFYLCKKYITRQEIVTVPDPKKLLVRTRKKYTQ